MYTNTDIKCKYLPKLFGQVIEKQFKNQEVYVSTDLSSLRQTLI